MYACSLCDKILFTQKSLKRHRDAVHRQSAGFSCAVCHQRFYRKDNLRGHVKTQHSASHDGALSLAHLPVSLFATAAATRETQREVCVRRVPQNVFQPENAEETLSRRIANRPALLVDCVTNAFTEKIASSNITPENTPMSSKKHQLLTPAPVARRASTTKAI